MALRDISSNPQHVGSVGSGQQLIDPLHPSSRAVGSRPCPIIGGNRILRIEPTKLHVKVAQSGGREQLIHRAPDHISGFEVVACRPCVIAEDDRQLGQGEANHAFGKYIEHPLVIFLAQQHCHLPDLDPSSAGDRCAAIFPV